MVELESTEHHLRFPEDAGSLMQEQVPRQGPELPEVQAAPIAAKSGMCGCEIQRSVSNRVRFGFSE